MSVFYSWYFITYFYLVFYCSHSCIALWSPLAVLKGFINKIWAEFRYRLCANIVTIKCQQPFFSIKLYIKFSLNTESRIYLIKLWCCVLGKIPLSENVSKFCQANAMINTGTLTLCCSAGHRPPGGSNWFHTYTFQPLALIIYESQIFGVLIRKCFCQGFLYGWLYQRAVEVLYNPAWYSLAAK